MRKKYLLGCLILVLIGSCVEPFNPDIPNFQNALVVEGQMLEGKGGARVILSRSFGFDETEPPYVKGATVVIRNDQGQEHRLTEWQDGHYRSDTNVWVGVPGLSYQLFLETPQGERVESAWEPLQASAQLEDIRPTFEMALTGFDTLYGMKVYLDIASENQDGRFYRWEFEETWMFRVPFPTRGYWDTDIVDAVFVEPDSIPRTCFISEKSTDILLGDTEGLSEPRLENFPLHYITTEDDRLKLKYSMLIKQYTLSDETYNFWTQLKEVNQDLGTLFDPIPSELAGNLTNLTNADLPVLGYFSADGYTEQRIFIDRIDFTSEIVVPTGYETCTINSFFSKDEMQRYVLAGNNWVGAITDFFGNIVGYTGATKSCSDCRTRGATITKPKFWP
ncbi:MAG: DUF4249 domain-containing protein [Bacteroidota bacterium]